MIEYRKRVGVITLPSNSNYGNQLQLYATISIFRSLGFDAVNLHYMDKYNYWLHPKVFLKKLLGKQVQISKEESSTQERIEAFKRFASAYETTLVERPEDIQKCNFDYFSVGSDQVWNPEFILSCGAGSRFRRICYYYLDRRNINRAIDWYFLRFANRNQRIALAPSIGIYQFDSIQSKILCSAFNGFDKLSVREHNSVRLLKETYGLDATLLSDPTTAISAEEWRQVSDNRCTPASGEPFVLTYLLGGLNNEAEELLERVTNRRKMPVISLSDSQQPGEPDAGPAEFIDLIDNASLVVTDSYHASIFSMLLHTPLVITKRQGNAPNMFSRIESLADTFDLRKNIYQSSSFDFDALGDYSASDAAIVRERLKFITYLKGCLNA